MALQEQARYARAVEPRPSRVSRYETSGGGSLASRGQEKKRRRNLLTLHVFSHAYLMAHEEMAFRCCLAATSCKEMVWLGV